jgi:hypothetical protein
MISYPRKARGLFHECHKMAELSMFGSISDGEKSAMHIQFESPVVG